MLQLHLEDGRTVQRVIAGCIANLDDLRKFVHDAEEEVRQLKEGETLLCEVWQTVGRTRIRKRVRIPTEEEEMSAAERR